MTNLKIKPTEIVLWVGFLLIGVGTTTTLLAQANNTPTRETDTAPSTPGKSRAPSKSITATQDFQIDGRSAKPVPLAPKSNAGKSAKKEGSFAAHPVVHELPSCSVKEVLKVVYLDSYEYKGVLTCTKVWWPNKPDPTYVWRPEIGFEPCDAKHIGSKIVVHGGRDDDWAKIECQHTPDGEYGWVTVDESQ